ncbi:TnsD family Tn7-like transposition protein [Gallionella capsiferriformans]|uniref:Tn5468, transposition protein D n=1 Tax=Gallionella capsiferriformans (strain ES-2) TaxID=395494 RepID=D9SFF8_GALCS|nr:TnsD family Tn7-like transposition protein [Gallionella capsiferriformans]ADL55255.1 Tn5468, transposition protein D [Gallionella capsiferriformans ES-2]
MLSYFPAVYPGELLYSVLARYHRHTGLPGSMHTMETLFGKQQVIASIDLQGNLQELADRIPTERNLTANHLIDTLTLFPYVAAFEPPSLQAKVRQAMMRGIVKNLHIRLGLTASRVGRIESFRFCLECTQKMIASHGEMYWRRDHQLSSVLVCPEHGCLLLESNLSFVQHSRHEFIAATRANCPQHARPVIPMVDNKTLSHLQSLARLSTELLESPPTPRTFAGWTVFYRDRMIETGLALSDCRMDQQRFSQEFRNFYGRTLELFKNLLDGNGFSGNWLKIMVRKHRKASHPIYHLLVQNFLALRERHVSRFGTGPWACLNPLAQHRTATPIKEVTEHNNHGKITGVFTCNCGYVYTRSFNSATSEVGPPRFQQYGPLLKPALRKLIDDGVSRRKIGQILQLDPKTVFRLTRALDIEKQSKQCKSPSKDAPLKIPAKNTSIKKQLASSPGKNISASFRRDWVEVDEACIAKLSSLPALIYKESPPVRITFAELNRRIGKRDWLLTHQHLLPQTKAFLDRTLENLENFQLRRIRWAIQELESAGRPVKAWQVLRKTGLRSTDYREKINVELESAPALWRHAV